MKRLVAPLVLALVTCSLAACGSSSSSSKPSTAATSGQAGGQTPSKASYIAQADAICRSAQEQLKPIQAKVKQEGAGNRPALASALDQAAALASSTLAKLRALPRPPGDNSLAIRYYAGVATQTSLVRELANALRHNNAGAAARLARRINEGSVRVRQLAQAYGFKVCASPSG